MEEIEKSLHSDRREADGVSAGSSTDAQARSTGALDDFWHLVEGALRLPESPASRWHRAGVTHRTERIIDVGGGALVLLLAIGWAWTSDYGSSDNADEFKALLAYSPLHQLRPGVKYPATLVTTADHDDRVVPAHSFKFAARLQECQGGARPVLIRIETKAGHGAGKPTTKLIEEATDKLGFLVRELNMSVPADTDAPR